MGKTFALHVYSSDEYAENPDYAIVTLTDEMIKTILLVREKLIALKGEIGNHIYEINFFDYGIDFVSPNSDEEVLEQFEDLNTYNKGVVETDMIEGYEVEHTDCTLCHIVDSGIRFSSMIKHTDIKLSTSTIYFERLS